MLGSLATGVVKISCQAPKRELKIAIEWKQYSIFEQQECQFGVVVTRWFQSTRLTYAEPA